MFKIAPSLIADFCHCLGTVGIRAPCYLQCYSKECFDRCKRPHPSGTYHTIDLACHVECDPTCMNEKCPGGDYPGTFCVC